VRVANQRLAGLHGPGQQSPAMGRRLSAGLDYYKPTMSQLQFAHHPHAQVTFEFKNRNAGKPGGRLLDHISVPELQARLDRFQAGFNDNEVDYLAGLERVDGSGKMFSPVYLDYLRGRQLPPVTVSEVDCDLHVSTTGDWPMVTFWETVVLSEASGLYFENYVRDETLDLGALYAEGDRRLSEKIALLRAHPDIKLAEFGTRRRFSDEWQRHVVARLRDEAPGNLIGTSNVAWAHELGVAPIGSYAHEMDMVYAALADRPGGDLLGSHSRMMDDWHALYGDNVSIALTDTFGSKFFFDSLTTKQGEQWQGLRHDSGDPFEFGENAISWYETHRIDPKQKTLLFSDGLDMPTIVKLNDRFKGRTKVAFGVGTNLTNDLGLPPLNVVMKATSVDGMPTVKLSDNPGKHIGPAEKVAQYERAFLGGPVVKPGTPMGGVPSLPASEAVAAGKAAPPTGGAPFDPDKLGPGGKVIVTGGQVQYEVRRSSHGGGELQFRVLGSKAEWKKLPQPGEGWVIGG
jgi:nicotinate phosphoribosyltransferase